ncbi:hypothetical protein BDB01DRAFT_781559 [Pilobolus umbonatus]|nr:hypothetical protein BDB01DRAFT_781559 [Pilobolus umbonatus]
MVLSDITHRAFAAFSSSSTTYHRTPDGLTLEMVLQGQTSPPFSLNDFSNYLKSTYCNENLLFYEAVMAYRGKCRDDFQMDPIVHFETNKLNHVLLKDGKTQFNFSSSDISMLSDKEKDSFINIQIMFEEILTNFILSEAPQEINIPYEVRNQLLQQYETEKLYHPALLYPACTAVIELLRISAFIPFATDPNRLTTKSMKSSLSSTFSARKLKSTPSLISTKSDNLSLSDQSVSLLPNSPTTAAYDTGFIKRITSSFKFKYSSSNNSSNNSNNSSNNSNNSSNNSNNSSNNSNNSSNNSNSSSDINNNSNISNGNDNTGTSPESPKTSNWRQINIPEISPFKITSSMVAQQNMKKSPSITISEEISADTSTSTTTNSSSSSSDSSNINGNTEDTNNDSNIKDNNTVTIIN